MPQPGVEQFEFGPYRMNSAERLLHHGDQRVALPPKVAETLLVLLRNAGHMVDKTDLMKAVWPDTYVEEGALTRNISLLRKALGETGELALYIETIPRRGYRFIAPVRQRTGATPAQHLPASSSPTWRVVAGVALLLTLSGTGGTPSRQRNSYPPLAVARGSPAGSLAVLPLRSIQNDASQDYFADGMTEALITSLGRFGKVRTVSLAAGARVTPDAVWKAIREDPTINRVLSWTVMRSSESLRIDARLIDPRTRTVCWTNSYERKMRDLLAVESELAEAIAAEIQGSLIGLDRNRARQRPVNPAALDAYRHGRHFWNRRTEDGLKRAIQYFQQAIDAAPDYAPAYSGLADAYSLLGSIGTDGMPPREAMPKAKAAAEKALDLDPGLADAHVSLAYVKLSYDWDLPGAAKQFSEAMALNPNSATGRHWLSHYFLATGDVPQATEQMRLALELEPLSPSINIGIGWCLYYSRDYDRAIERFRFVTESDPSLPLAHQTLGMAYQQRGLLDKAFAEYQRAAELSGDNPGSVAGMAGIYAASGEKAGAERMLALLQKLAGTRYVPALYFASVYLPMGNLPKALESLRTSIDERCDYWMYMRLEPRVGKLARNPDFARLLSELHP